MINIDELTFLNNILDGKELKEIELKKDINKIDVINSLVNKKMLNDNISINENSATILKALERYKKSRRYLKINDFFCTLEKNESMIAIKKVKNNYEIYKVNRSGFILRLIEDYSMLRKKYECENEIIKTNKVQMVIDLENRKKEDEVIHIKEIKDDKILNDYVYLGSKDRIYEYDLLNDIKQDISSSEVKTKIKRIIYQEG